MIKEILLNNRLVKYSMQYKDVKNINLRIKPDGSIHVSANRLIPQRVIDEFILSRSDFILNALEKYKNITPPKQYFSDDEIPAVILGFCEKAYPYFEARGVKYPEIKFRAMVSRWGSCHTQKNVLTFNTNLMYAPAECIEYVVLHEFTHFLQANHSSRFYEELSKVCPDWKILRKRLKEIKIL